MRSFAFPAVVAVIDERLFNYRGDSVEDGMVNDPVPEIRSEDLSLHWFVDDETDAPSWSVLMRNDFVIQLEHTPFKVHFEFRRLIVLRLFFRASRDALRNYFLEFVPDLEIILQLLVFLACFLES